MFLKVFTEKDVDMVKNVMGLSFLVVLMFLASITGCSNKDEVNALKEELAKTKDELQHWQNRYDAISTDLRNAKASQRNLGTQLNNAGDASKTVEEQLLIYQQQVTTLAAQVQQLTSAVNEQDTIIKNQDAIIAEQEAALQEFLDASGQDQQYVY